MRFCPLDFECGASSAARPVGGGDHESRLFDYSGSRRAGDFLLRSLWPRRGSCGPGRHREKPVPGAEPDATKQSPVHGAIGGVVGGIDGAKNGLIDLDKGVRFREFVLRTHPKSVPYDEPVRVGAVLEKGLEDYDVPPEYGETPYRYTVIGGDPVPVDPNTRVIK